MLLETLTLSALTGLVIGYMMHALKPGARLQRVPVRSKPGVRGRRVR